MKKKLITLAAFLCCTIIAWALDIQSNRNQTFDIVLGNVQYAHHNEKLSAGDAIGKMLTGMATGQVSVQATKYEGDVKTAIVKGLSGAYRFRYNDALLTDKSVKEGDLVVDAVITNIQSKSSSRTWKDSKKRTQVTTTYTGIAETMLTIKDAKTGDVIANPTMSGKGTAGSSYSTSDQAIRDAINRMADRITDWLNKYRPIQANIIEGATAKKDKQKEVYIDLGENEGAFAGLHMSVFLVKSVAGREAKTQIGKLKIEAVEGENVSRCKVQSGGKDIKAALEAGQRLCVVSL